MIPQRDPDTGIRTLVSWVLALMLLVVFTAVTCNGFLNAMP